MYEIRLVLSVTTRAYEQIRLGAQSTAHQRHLAFEIL